MTDRPAPVDPELEREYSPSSRAGGSAEPFIADYRRRSASAVAALATRSTTLPDGTRVVRGEPDGAVLVFVHGGYWQALSAEASMFLAPAAVALGWSFAAVEYTIAPTGTLERMVDEVGAAVSSAIEVLAADGCAGPVVVAGHSAGAHLVAMSMVAMSMVAAPPPVAVRGVLLLSGVYDLRPLLQTTVNDALGLDEVRASALSPALLPVVVDTGDGPSILVAWGDHDTDAFIAQGRAYAEVLRAGGRRVTELELADRHHFDVVDEMVRPGAALYHAVAAAVRSPLC